MPSLFKPTYTAKDPKTGERKTRQASKWYGQYHDGDGILRRVPLAKDKSAAQMLLNELTRRAEQQKAGIADPFHDHRRRPLAGHLNDFEASLRDGGVTEAQTKLVTGRARKVVEGCRFSFIPDFSASRVASYLGKLKRDKGLSIQTCNFYLQSVKQFVRWLVKDRSTADNPLDHLKAGNVKLDRRHDRRALSDAELGRLIEAARRGETSRNMSGADRAMLYLTSAYTGLRASELASMTPANFNLDSPPTWTVEAAYSKNRERSVLPLHPRLVEELRPWFAEKAPDAPLWPGRWAVNKEAGVMMKRDLESAGIAYRDASGLVADFHSLRHTFITNLARSGVSPKVAQLLARHSTITLTMDRYTHVEMGDQAAALVGMPFLPVTAASTIDGEQTTATASDTVVSFSCTKLAQTDGAACHELASDDPQSDLEVVGPGGPKSNEDKEFDAPCPSLASSVSGGGGIRTHGTGNRPTGFRDRPFRPLRHPSNLIFPGSAFPEKSMQKIGTFVSKNSCCNADLMIHS